MSGTSLSRTHCFTKCIVMAIWSLKLQVSPNNQSSVCICTAWTQTHKVEPDKQTACRLPSLTAANEADAKAQGRSRARLSKGPCMSAKKLSGSWKAFDLTAVPIDETDPSTGHSRNGLHMQVDTTQSLSRSCLLSAYSTGMLCLPCVSCVCSSAHCTASNT